MTTTEAGRLEPISRRPWSTVLAALPTAAMRWLWADPSGVVQRDDLPPRAPMTTHVWGWGQETWVRLRVDLDDAVGAVLRPGADGPGTAVTYCRYAATVRDGREVAAGMLHPDDLQGREMTILQVTGRAAMAFLDVGPGKRAKSPQGAD